MSSSMWQGQARLQSGQRLGILAVAGVIGGFLGTKLSEIPTSPNPNDYADVDSYLGDLRNAAGLQFMLVMVTIGVALILANSFLEKAPPSGTQIARALVALVVLGFLSGYIAQSIYSSMLESVSFEWCELNPDSCEGKIQTARTIGWGIAGCLGGIGIGLGYASMKRFQNAVAGGLLGGLVGGFFFDSIAGDGDASTSRVFGTCLIGLLIGLLIAVAETVRASVWLEIVSGEARGRQYILFDDETKVGSARGVGVTLVGDRSIAEHHLTIRRSGNTATFDCMSGRSVTFRGAESTHGQVVSGDVLRIGNTDVMVQFKAASAGQPSGYAGVASPSPTAPPRQAAHIVPSSPSGRPNASPISNAPVTGAGAPLPPPGPGRPPSPPASPPAARPTLPTKKP